mmetsp:Transcript_49263/g.98486  ORF Transcript_49263/g.98486 Transcript_49263/m.98486 type:complete len:228 (-) Transcript_49263:238-921(-)
MPARRWGLQAKERDNLGEACHSQLDRHREGEHCVGAAGRCGPGGSPGEAAESRRHPPVLGAGVRGERDVLGGAGGRVGRHGVDRCALHAGAARRNPGRGRDQVRDRPGATAEAAHDRGEPEDVPDPLREQHAPRALLGHIRPLPHLRAAQQDRQRLGTGPQRKHRMRRQRPGGVRQALPVVVAPPHSELSSLRLLPRRPLRPLRQRPPHRRPPAHRRHPLLRPDTLR